MVNGKVVHSANINAQNSRGKFVIPLDKQFKHSEPRRASKNNKIGSRSGRMGRYAKKQTDSQQSAEESEEVSDSNDQ